MALASRPQYRSPQSMPYVAQQATHARRFVLHSGMSYWRQGASHLEVEVIVQAQHAVLISGIIVVDVAQQLDLVKTLIEVVLIVLQSQDVALNMMAGHRKGMQARWHTSCCHRGLRRGVALRTFTILRQTSPPVFMSMACTALLKAADPRKSTTCGGCNGSQAHGCLPCIVFASVHMPALVALDTLPLQSSWCRSRMCMFDLSAVC